MNDLYFIFNSLTPAFWDHNAFLQWGKGLVYLYLLSIKNVFLHPKFSENKIFYTPLYIELRKIIIFINK